VELFSLLGNFGVEVVYFYVFGGEELGELVDFAVGAIHNSVEFSVLLISLFETCLESMECAEKLLLPLHILFICGFHILLLVYIPLFVYFRLGDDLLYLLFALMEFVLEVFAVL
jgi:hypothetical protein